MTINMIWRNFISDISLPGLTVFPYSACTDGAAVFALFRTIMYFIPWVLHKLHLTTINTKQQSVKPGLNRYCYSISTSIKSSKASLMHIIIIIKLLITIKSMTLVGNFTVHEYCNHEYVMWYFSQCISNNSKNDILDVTILGLPL